MTRRPSRRTWERIVKLPAGWHSTRRSGTVIGDVLVPAIFLLLALFTVALVVVAAGILTGIIHWE